MPYKDKNKQRSASLESKRKKLRWVAELKLSRGCDLCGYNKSPLALHFHHRNPEEKFKEINRMASSNTNREVILEEISKCMLVCANCHAVINGGAYFCGDEQPPQPY